MSEVFSSLSPEETEAIASGLGSKAEPGDIYALEGDLGAGKTVFARGFARGVGFPDAEEVASPTFTILRIYEGGRLPIYHFDMYRLSDESEALDMGADEYLFGDGASLVEWPSRIEGLLQDAGRRLHTVVISRKMERGDDYRQIEVRP